MKINEEMIIRAKNIDCVQYLESIGYPIDKKHTGTTYTFFRSPFSDEKTASLAIHKRKNTWFDYGRGFGGDCITLVMRIEKLNFIDAIHRLIGIPLQRDSTMREYKEEDNISSVEVLEVKELQSKVLIDYLKSRRISEIVFPFVKEVKVNNNGKIWSGIGFRNNKNSWELRNKYVKIALAPKDITTLILTENKDYSVFEGFMDFLSYVSFYNKPLITNIIVLNSVSLVGRVDWSKIEGNIYYYGDADRAGDEALRHIERGIDMRHVFAPYKDMNDFLKATFIF